MAEANLQAKLQGPVIDTSLTAVRKLFAPESKYQFEELRNPHLETPVADAVRNKARTSAVLILLSGDESAAKVLFTRRHHGIRFGGHICFPGGTEDPDDPNPEFTALRETEEEIGLSSHRVEVLGRLGNYYSQAGYLIQPVVGVIDTLPPLNLNPAEVDEVYQVPLTRILDTTAYQLNWHGGGHGQKRGHYSFYHREPEQAQTHNPELTSASSHRLAQQRAAVLQHRIAGPTVSIMIGLLETLAAFQTGQ